MHYVTITITLSTDDLEDAEREARAWVREQGDLTYMEAKPDGEWLEYAVLQAIDSELIRHPTCPIDVKLEDSTVVTEEG